MYYKTLAGILATFIFLMHASSIFAGDPPALINPQNNSTVTSSKLEWQVPAYTLYTQGNPYRVQVDDSLDFTPSTSIYRNEYTDNTFYSPQLTPGIWYWRVMAKDSNGTWSSWSDPWQFALTTATSPSPSPSSSPSPTPSQSPSPTPTPKPSLTISNIPSSVKVDQEFSVNISIINFQPNSTYYLKGAFKLSGGANYFGSTKVGSHWVKNKEHYSDQDHITTDPSGNWNGNLNVQGDPSDAGFTGEGNYIFKVGYYFNSSSVSWSNEVNIFLDSPSGTTATSVPQPKPSSSPKSGNLTNTQAFITGPPTGPTLKPTLTPMILGTISASPFPPTPSTETPRTQVASSTLANIFMIGTGLIIILIAVLTFTFLKNGHFYNPFTKRNF